MANTRVTNPVTDFDKSTSLPGLKLPSGTNANQPSGVQGMIRNDTGETTGSSASAIEHHNGTTWKYFAATESADPIIPENPYNNVLYTGNGGTKAVTGLGFQPDFVWSKSISTSGTNHILSNVITGTGSNLYSNSTLSSGTRGVTSFDTDGFTYSYPAEGGDANYNGQSYVAWCWKAGGAAVSNTDGDVESQVSANVAGGFSIVKGTGSGSGVQSVGHGLSSAPEFVMVKRTNVTDNWFCLVPGLTSTNYYMRLNTTDAEVNNGTPTIFADSTTVSVRQNSMGPWGDLIAYCFASVPGYSKVGSFVGTGVAGKKIDLDFEPAYILTKRVSSSGASWSIIDNKRSTGSNKNNYLQANSNAAEATSSSGITFNTDGFTFNGSSFNTNGATHMYYAIA